MVKRNSKTNITSNPRTGAGSIERGTRERRFIGYSSFSGIPVAVTLDGGQWWTTTGADPSRMITLKTKASSADPYADLLRQFRLLTRDLRPKRPVALPESLRVVRDEGLDCWLTDGGTLTFTGTIDLNRSARNWQAETLRLVQLVVRRLPASDRFNKIINQIKKGEQKHV
ncbi:MAG: hypothetical protein IJT19_03865 [Bacteroidaceae bacterium]|nr:hypothetical protein [Bacteroidaceae bacterium]